MKDIFHLEKKYGPRTAGVIYNIFKGKFWHPALSNFDLILFLALVGLVFSFAWLSLILIPHTHDEALDMASPQNEISMSRNQNQDFKQFFLNQSLSFGFSVNNDEEIRTMSLKNSSAPERNNDFDGFLFQYSDKPTFAKTFEAIGYNKARIMGNSSTDYLSLYVLNGTSRTSIVCETTNQNVCSASDLDAKKFSFKLWKLETKILDDYNCSQNASYCEQICAENMAGRFVANTSACQVLFVASNACFKVSPSASGFKISEGCYEDGRESVEYSQVKPGKLHSFSGLEISIILGGEQQNSSFPSNEKISGLSRSEISNRVNRSTLISLLLI